MTFVRESVFKNGNDWDDTTLWYAKGVAALRQRPFTDRTSWRFLAAIHGWHDQLWQVLGYLDATEARPGRGDIDTYFSKCQHGSWYFLPWHRGYLSAFERIVRAAIVAQGGPADWALPYWNYSDPANPAARTIPVVFVRKTLPDGSPNALYTPFRFGDEQTGALSLTASEVRLDALREPRFGSDQRIAGGFGGGRWEVSHQGRAPGMLEGTPHGDVHVAIGGSGVHQGQQVPGLMSSFVTAGLDPVFWLHHCNIDRLWEVWLKRNPAHANPARPEWRGGPLDRPFVMPDEAGNPWKFACSDVIDTKAAPLGYVYDDTSDPLGDAAGLLESHSANGKSLVHEVDWEDRDTQLISANEAALPIGTEGASARVPVPGATLLGAAEQMMAESVAPEAVERYFLLLDDIRGDENTAIYEVYVDYGEPGQMLPSGAPRESLVGTLSTFGITTSDPEAPEADAGLSRLYNITPVVEQMGFDEVPDLESLHVRIVPVTQNRAVAPPTIGRIAVYRETA